jgi:hypothetical protein
MTADRIQFPAQTVERHAAVVTQVGEAIELARSAVHDVTMDSGAYGVLCQFVPVILSPVFALGADALHRTVDVMHETAADLRATAASMSATDTAGGRRIAQAAPELPL